MIPDSVRKFNSQRQLIWERITVQEKGIILKIVLSKTVQDYSRVQEIPIASDQDSPFCAVTSLKKLASIPGYPCGPRDPVFNIPDMNGGWIPLS